MRVRDALARHYVAHGLPSDGGASDPWFRVALGPVTLRLPNPPARRRAVFFHDVNHVVTGYDTTFSGGEMAIAGFEVGAGCGNFGIVWYINLSMMALGLIANPRAVFAAFVRGRRSTSIYREPQEPAALAEMSVADVRAQLRLDEATGRARFGDVARFAAWSPVAIIVLLAPLILLGSAVWTVTR
jgi:hypothetical protein